MQTKGQLMKSLHTAFSFAPPSILSLTIFRSLRLPNKREFYAFLIGCLITVFHFSGATFLASDI